jgi:hypothetical protein
MDEPLFPDQKVEIEDIRLAIENLLFDNGYWASVSTSDHVLIETDDGEHAGARFNFIILIDHLKTARCPDFMPEDW